ncbi:MAG TPA: acyl carrier protein [Brumimicrobium sp.]|nr:acyl carrier protein [Brumimicrobium sp.]
MEMKDIIEQVNEVLVDEFEVEAETITPEANLRETLDLDSLDYVDLVVAIESISGVKLGEDDFKGIETFKNFYEVLQAKIEEKTN